MREVLKSKIHRAWVTDHNVDYVGSIVIDQALMEKADMWEYEKVLCCNVNNGNRFETYVLPGPYGDGDISVQGAAAKLCENGDCLIILSFELTDEPVEPKMVLVDRNNQFAEYLGGVQHAQQVH